MEKSCKYCGELFIGKRRDSVYCSSSCRQMAYVERRLNPFPHEAINGIRNEISFAHRSGKTSINESQQNREPSIDSSPKNDPSMDGLEPDVKALRQKQVGIHSTQAITNDSVTTLTDNEPDKDYEPVKSKFLTAIADLSNGRNHLSVLNRYLYYHKNTPSYEVGLRLKCLIECLLLFSEMNRTELEDLKEVCNAFTLTIGSSYYKQLPAEFPYKSYVVLLRDKLKQIIIENHHAENIRFGISLENKIELLATRFELSEFYTKTRFCDLNFSE